MAGEKEDRKLDVMVDTETGETGDVGGLTGGGEIGVDSKGTNSVGENSNVKQYPAAERERQLSVRRKRLTVYSSVAFSIAAKEPRDDPSISSSRSNEAPSNRSLYGSSKDVPRRW
jgi:hypothetical protein